LPTTCKISAVADRTMMAIRTTIAHMVISLLLIGDAFFVSCSSFAFTFAPAGDPEAVQKYLLIPSACQALFMPFLCRTRAGKRGGGASKKLSANGVRNPSCAAPFRFRRPWPSVLTRLRWCDSPLPAVSRPKPGPTSRTGQKKRPHGYVTPRGLGSMASRRGSAGTPRVLIVCPDFTRRKAG